MIELKYQFQGDKPREITVRLGDVKLARPDDNPAPWDIGLKIIWGDEVAFDYPLAGADPLHAVELAAKYASNYISGRAHDEGGALEPAIPPP